MFHIKRVPHTAQAGSRDAGIVLPLALVLTVVLGAVVVAIAGYATSTLRAGSVVQDRVERLSAADGGVRIGMEKLRTKTASCASTTVASTIYTGTIDTTPVVVRCTRTTLKATDVGMFALVVTGEGVPGGSATLLAEGTNALPKTIGGNVYLARPPAALNKPVSVTDGDVWFYGPDCASATDPSYGVNMSFKPADERGYTCTSDAWQTWFPIPALPAKNTSPGKAAGRTNNAGCTEFYPGTYNSPPTIGSGTQNFFHPGTYYFNFDGPIVVKNAVVIGGVTRGIGNGSSAVARTPTTLAAPWCAGAISSATAGSGPTGVTWVFGRTSRLLIDANGQVELFEQTPFPTVVALQTAAGGYDANTYGPGAGPLIQVQEGASTGVVAHGRVWAPGSKVVIGNVAGFANAQFMGGLVVGMLDLQSSASAGNFNLRVLTTPATKRVVVTSVADVTKVKAVALVRSGTGEYKIQSWRVE